MTNTTEQALRDALESINALLALIRRDAPHLSGKTMGYANSVALRIENILSLPPSEQEPVAISQAERWVVVRESALDVGLGNDVRTGGRPELGYALIANPATFESESAAVSAVKQAGLPLGWVVMPISRLLPDLYTHPAPQTAEVRAVSVPEPTPQLPEPDAATDPHYPGFGDPAYRVSTVEQLQEAWQDWSSAMLATTSQAPSVPDGVRKDAERLDWLESEIDDLRAVTTGDDDYEWVVISHHIAKPHEREIGRGKTARAAIDAALAEQSAKAEGGAE